jgi:preprotein translocase subunit SecE
MESPIHHVRQFCQETLTELRKCTWPTRTELTESTLVVITSVIILGVFVALVDWVTQTVIRLVTVAS